MASIKKNIILNGIGTVSNFIFPLITFPYAARILLPEGIGTMNFLGSIVNYIVLLTSLGIPMYAVKEIAKYREDKESLNKITIEILILSVLLCLGGYFLVWILATFIPAIHKQAALFYVLSLSIIFTGIGVNWFYQGIEDFKFITIRGVLVRAIAAACLFIFVKNTSDLIIYGFISVGSTVGNYLLNFIHLRKYINFRTLKLTELNVFRHLKPALHIFILNLIISLYIQLNSVMLGFMSGEIEVGFFSAGTKISHIGLSVVASLGTVLLPRCSNLIKKGETDAFQSIIEKSIKLTTALSVPMIVGLWVLATPVTLLFCGKEFIDSIPVLFLNAPVIAIIGITNVLGIQILYPMDKVNTVIASVAGGAIVNIILNILLIPPYGAVGAAISTLVAELTVLILQLILGRKIFPIKWSGISLKNYFIAAVIMGAVLIGFIRIIHSTTLQVILGIIFGFLSYLLTLLLLRDNLAKDILKLIIKKH